MSDLDARLLRAHAQDDRAALIRLYTEAADTAGDATATAFYLTHAYVFALEAGDASARGLHARLVSMGRDE